MRVLHVEIVALIAPAFAEDLLELLAGLQVHPERHVEPPLPGRRRVAIRIDKKQVDGSAGPAATSATACPAARAIEKLPTVGAHVVLGNAGDEWRRTPVADAIPLQRRAATGSTATAARTRFEVIHRAGDAGPQLAVLTLGHARHRDDALLQPVEVDLHGDGYARRARRLRGSLIIRAFSHLP